ncbi:ATP-grasp domain-containing protein [Kineosporia babensis]|uniref:ATP-grasp domain-containing protein n=1 Tax=Kineosporia babensis TaxID=499548 RepID=A0A9X1NN12_9ACTN|nr:hypothetical protein [Kineosporia babensis]MCD5316083.1 hypothetical protein [Kineosporia babensis]
MTPAFKTIGTLALLTAALPVNLAITATALIRNPRREPPPNENPLTVLISGGKMTKALQLARSFHAEGHRVVLVEQAKYRFTGHRFSRAVAAFHTVPPPRDPGYAQALLDIVRREKVDVYVPVCSPAASYYDALAAPLLKPYCEVIHADADLVRQLDDKHAFIELAASLGLPVPDSHRITAPQQVTDFDFTARPGPYVLKSIAYDPVHRLDLTPLPRPTPADTAEFVHSKPISPENPWIMQAYVEGQEYCTHSTVREGRITVFCCCESSAFQVNYADVDQPEIRQWVEKFAGALKLTGQISFDFMLDRTGTVHPIECNPRTHSAVTMFYDHPGLARAYLDRDGPVIDRPTPDSRPTYWTYHELWRMLSHPAAARTRLAVIRNGKDAIFDRNDPLPFLLVHHLQIPSLLLHNLRLGKPWIRIDFNIGKLVEPAGD